MERKNRVEILLFLFHNVFLFLLLFYQKQCKSRIVSTAAELSTEGKEEYRKATSSKECFLWNCFTTNVV